MPTVKANGIKMYYEEYGSGQQSLVLVHGWTGAQTNWCGLVQALPLDRLHVYAFDVRGAGRSDRPASNYSMAQLADDVAAATKNLGIGSFYYAGHSMGGVIGMQLGLRHQGRVEGLVLVAPAPSEGILAVDPDEQFLKGMSEAIGDGDKHRDFIVQNMTGRAIRDDILEYQRREYLACSKEHLEGCWEGLKEDISSRLDEIRTPTLIVAGDRDFLCQANLRDAARIPECALQVFYRVGHLIPSEAPEQVAALIADFIENGVAQSALS